MRKFVDVGFELRRSDVCLIDVELTLLRLLMIAVIM